MENKADNLCGGTYSAFSSPNEILSERDSCMSCSMHRIRSCAHTLRRDQESGTQVRVEIGMWKKLFKGRVEASAGEYMEV